MPSKKMFSSNKIDMNEYMSPITPTIIVEDDLDCDLYDDDSSSQTKYIIRIE